MLRNKKIFIGAAILIFVLSISAFAAAPKLLNFQGRLINKDTGAPITGGVQVTFELFKAGDVTTNWDETVNVSCDNEGVFSVVLGDGIKPLDTVNFNQPLWMEIEYNSQVFAPKQKLTATPYAMHAINGVPVGTVLPFAGSIRPDGYLFCDGTLYDIGTDYPELYAAIGTDYNDGSEPGGKYRVPDMRGIFPRGAGISDRLTDANLNPFSATLGTYQDDASQGHHHQLHANNTGDAGGGDVPNHGQTQGILGNEQFISAGGGNCTSFGKLMVSDGTNGTPRTATETRPANLALNFIIKY